MHHPACPSPHIITELSERAQACKSHCNTARHRTYLGARGKQIQLPGCEDTHFFTGYFSRNDAFQWDDFHYRQNCHWLQWES